MSSSRCVGSIRDRLWLVSPGVLNILNFLSRKKYGKAFTVVFVERPEDVYELVLEAVNDRHWADVVVKTMLTGLVDKGYLTPSEILEKMKNKEKIKWGDHISACSEEG
ncbi:MAG: hypothetical protein F7B59_01125 [Desulfurococcales archaeon]|nr:hypothetical protein [Desulfurococcales archaeon]